LRGEGGSASLTDEGGRKAPTDIQCLINPQATLSAFECSKKRPP